MGASSGTYGDYGFGVTPDSSGNIYVSGHTYRGYNDYIKDNSQYLIVHRLGPRLTFS